MANMLDALAIERAVDAGWTSPATLANPLANRVSKPHRARRRKSVDVRWTPEVKTGASAANNKELTCRNFPEPSDGLEPSTPLYEEGPRVKCGCCVAVMAGVLAWFGEQRSSLYRLLVGGSGWMGASLPVAHLLKGRQATRGFAAPAGAKGWSRVSMCQIASVSWRARSIWATLAPRCLPSRCLVCW